jgi:CHAT domain-containing protein
VVTKEGALPVVQVEDVTYEEMLKTVRTLESNLVNKSQSQDILPQASQLYDWIIAPIQTQLQNQKIDNLTFILGPGLRTLPIAALYNAQTQQYVIENYSVSLMPSLSLTDLTPKARQAINNTQVLAMGAETFPDQNPLPAVPIELSEITQKLLTGEMFLNQNFTVDNFKKAFDTQVFNIVHLATHGEFKPGNRSNSYIYFSDRKLNFDQFASLGLDRPKVDLLVLSACKTALGDLDAELGFAGLAVKTGVRAALGSLWYVSDEGTLALMTLFYDKLKTTQIKTEALRQAQLALLKGKYQIVGNELILDNSIRLSLTPQLLNNFEQNLSNPYYWSAFTLIGNPW